MQQQLPRPGSGKTRVVAARVAHLIASGAAPESLLVITFTGKAAGELLQRLRELLGEAVASRLRPSTFHALCANLLRRYKLETGVPDFQVASEEDAQDMVKSILDNKKFRQSMRYSKQEEQDKKIKDEAVFYRKHISNIKNLCVNIDGRSGMQLIAEIAAAGRRMPGGDSPEITCRIAVMYDEYVARMAQEQLLDFDDLLHHSWRCSKPTRVHGRWQHVLVDESQDTNLCQFELVRQLTSPSSSLFMVGDPDQGIYGFRGAKASLLAQHFSKLYGPAAGTRSLSENYRSREPIVDVAEIVRRHARLSSDIAAAGRSRQPRLRNDTVTLMEADNDYDEADQVVLQLRQWHNAGYVWGEMAVLFRNRFHSTNVYSKAIAAGIPCNLWSRGEFFEAPEIKVALALLRCLVDPLRAGECIKKRLVNKGSTVKVPLMAGLGADAVDSLAAAYAADSSSSSNSLGSCLLGDLPSDLDAQHAVAPLQQYTAATAAGTADTEALQGLAAAWQPPAGAKKPTKKQRAAVDRLRGLVLLGRAAAAALPPEQVLQLLLVASGLLPQLQAALQEKGAVLRPNSADKAEQRKLRKRIGNMKTLRKLARNPTTGLPLLQQLYDYCVLQGEDDEDADDAEKVQLMTMHASKGKEFACVAVLRVHDGSIPSVRTDEPGGQSAAMEQERNLLYVAITRAKEHCLLVWPKSMYRSFPQVRSVSGQPQALVVSRFLKPVLAAAAKGLLPGVQKLKRRYVETK
ncbi:P-loop containing nucleoside triphosphate hydrolase protein [Scenedesmus sp. NREL 46B-D3]|nr:P-loop containing nucleoside triphosphate hydrolase protein [Scenedesmus sp. NREL 46B-D3]